MKRMYRVQIQKWAVAAVQKNEISLDINGHDDLLSRFMVEAVTASDRAMRLPLIVSERKEQGWYRGGVLGETIFNWHESWLDFIDKDEYGEPVYFDLDEEIYGLRAIGETVQDGDEWFDFHKRMWRHAAIVNQPAINAALYRYEKGVDVQRYIKVLDNVLWDHHSPRDCHVQYDAWQKLRSVLTGTAKARRS